jgi:hypothetical protein
MAHGPDPRLEQFPSAAVDIYGGGSICLPIPKRIIPYLLGGLDLLRYPDAWNGTPADINRTTGQVENFIIDLIQKQECTTPCPDCPPANGDGGPSAAGGGSACYFMEDDMPCIDISTKLKVEDGQLYALNDCCQWVAIGALYNQVPGFTPSGIDALIPQGQSASACGRAWGVWSAITRTVDAVWDHKFDIPWQIIRNIEAQVPDVKIDRNCLIDALGIAIILDSVFSINDLEDPQKLALFLARLEAQFDATTGPLSDSEYDAIGSAISGSFSLGIEGLYQKVAYCVIGRNELSAIAQLSAINDSFDCGDPGMELFDVTQGWDDVDWSYWWDFTQADKPAWMAYASGAGGTWEQYLGLAKPITGGGTWRLILEMPFLPEAGVIQHLYALLDMPPGFNYSDGAGYNEFRTDAWAGVLHLGLPGWYDTDPSAGGLITVSAAALAKAIGGSDNTLRLDISGEDAVHDGSHKIVIKAVGIGGTGTDPFSGH